MTALCPRHPDALADPVLCTRCADRLRCDLRDLRDLLPHLPALREPGRSAGGGPRREPPAPIRLDVVDTLDVLAAVVGSWARFVVEERRLSTVPDTTAGALTLLWRHDRWLLEHPVADEFADEIADTARRVRGITGDNPPPALGRCPELVDGHDCGGPLRIQHTGDVLCGRCGAAWSALDLPHILRVVAPTRRIPQPAGWVCERFGLAPATLRQWVHRGHVRRYADGQVDLLDVLARVACEDG